MGVIGKHKRKGRAKQDAAGPKKEKLSFGQVERLMRADGYERRGGALRQTRRAT